MAGFMRLLRVAQAGPLNQQITSSFVRPATHWICQMLEVVRLNK